MKLENTIYDTAPIFEALVDQGSYVAIWKCENSEDGGFYQVDYNLVGHMSPEDRAKMHPPRHVEVAKGWFEDGLSRAGERKPSVYVRTFAEAMELVMADIAEHKLEDINV